MRASACMSLPELKDSGEPVDSLKGSKSKTIALSALPSLSISTLASRISGDDDFHE